MKGFDTRSFLRVRGASLIVTTTNIGLQKEADA